MSKLDRRNQARQKQQLKHQEKAQAVSIFAGQNGAPRQVAVVPLSVDIDVAAVIRSMNASVDVEGDISADGLSRVRIDRFRQNVQYILAKYDLMNALDACRMADFVVLVMSAEVEVEDEGELILRSIESQGISNTMAAVQVCMFCNAMRPADSWVVPGQIHPSEETTANCLFPQVFREPLLPVR